MFKNKKYLPSLLVISYLLFVNTPVFAAPPFPDDPLFKEQWYLNRIQAVGAWEKSTGSPDVVVAILDTGIDIDHPDIAGRIWKNSKEHSNNKDDDKNGFIDDTEGWDFIDDDNNPRPNVESPKLTRTGVNHGTILAGVLGAITGNGFGIAGINWRVRIMPIRVLDSEGIGNTVTVEKGIKYAVENGADVINLSFVGKNFNQSFYNTVFDAWTRGVVVVSASGNTSQGNGEGDGAPLYPACFSGSAGENIILGVAATDRDDKLASFSNFSKDCVDILSPGVGIFSTQVIVPGNTIFHDAYGGGWSGTSVAAAITSGVAALIKSYNRDLTAKEIIQIIVDNSENIDHLGSKPLGRGRLNAFLALQAAADYVRGQGRSLVKTGALVVGPATKTAPPAGVARIFKSTGEWLLDIKAHGESQSGLNVAAGNINNDDFPEIITVPGEGGTPLVKLWQSNGRLAQEFFAYEAEFKGGVEVAFANLDGSGSDQIVTVPMSNRESEVRIWKYDGTLFNKFLAFPENYKGGANISVRDFDRDGQDEIVVAPRGNIDPVIKIFRPDGILISAFSIAPPRTKTGTAFTVGDLNGDGWAEILTTSIRGSPSIRVWNYLGRELRPSFYLTPKYFRGASLGSGDTDGDGKDEIIIGSPVKAKPEVYIYDMTLRLKKKFSVYTPKIQSGVNVAVVK